MEIWKDILGYEGVYMVSNKGNIKRLVGYRARKERVLNKNMARDYYTVTLCKNAVHDCRMIHKIVAQHFVENPLNKPQVNHIDNNPTNNCAENLEWTTQKENIQHALKCGRIYRKGESAQFSKLTEKDVLDIRERRRNGEMTKSIAKDYGIKPSYVSTIALRITWKHI